MREFHVEYNANLAKQLIKGFEDLREKLDDDVLPDIPEEYLKKRGKTTRNAILPYECRYCDFAETCDLFENKK